VRILPAFAPLPTESDAEAARRLQSQMQAAMTELARTRRTPWG
jgi:hypothetical protein